MKTTICNKCGQKFILDKHRFGIINEGEYEVQYFSCPACSERYHIFTADKEMRKLVEQRKVVQRKISLGHAKKFRRETLREYERELDSIKQKQEKMMPALNAVGEKILHGEGGEPDATVELHDKG